jgi:hypothetical protein
MVVPPWEITKNYAKDLQGFHFFPNSPGLSPRRTGALDHLKRSIGELG